MCGETGLRRTGPGGRRLTAGSAIAGAVSGPIGIGHLYAVPVGSGLLALGFVVAGGRPIRAGLAGRPPAVPQAPAGQPESVP